MLQIVRHDEFLDRCGTRRPEQLAKRLAGLVVAIGPCVAYGNDDGSDLNVSHSSNKNPQLSGGDLDRRPPTLPTAIDEAHYHSRNHKQHSC